MSSSDEGTSYYSVLILDGINANTVLRLWESLLYGVAVPISNRDVNLAASPQPRALRKPPKKSLPAEELTRLATRLLLIQTEYLNGEFLSYFSVNFRTFSAEIDSLPVNDSPNILASDSIEEQIIEA